MTESSTTNAKGKCKLVKNEKFSTQVRDVIKSRTNPATGIPFTAKEVAEAIGISLSSLNMQLNNNPTTNMLRAIAEVLGCDMVDFFRAEAAHSTYTSVSETELAAIADDLRRIADKINTADL